LFAVTKYFIIYLMAKYALLYNITGVAGRIPKLEWNVTAADADSDDDGDLDDSDDLNDSQVVLAHLKQYHKFYRICVLRITLCSCF